MSQASVSKLCGATSKNSGEPCRAPAMPNGRCYHHGGASLAGIAHPNFKHGRKIKLSNLPQRMLDDAQSALNDPELASMREDIVVLEARIADLIKRVDTGESGEAWRFLSKKVRDYQYEADTARKRMILMEIFDTIEHGLADYDAWDEVNKVIDQRARIIAAEQKRLQTNDQMIPADRALSVISSIMGAVRNEVGDPRVVSRIVRHVARVANAGDAIDVTVEQ